MNDLRCIIFLVSRFCHTACSVCQPSIPYSRTKYSGNIIFVTSLTVYKKILKVLFEECKILLILHPNVIHLSENNRMCSCVFHFHAQPHISVLLTFCHTNCKKIFILSDPMHRVRV